MTRRERAFERLRGANPVPDATSVLEVLDEPHVFLEATRHRSGAMQTEQFQRIEPKTTARYLRPAVAMAAFLVVVAIGVGTWLATRSDGSFDVATASGAEITEELVVRLDGDDLEGAAALFADSPSIDILFPVQERHVGVEGLLDYFAFYQATNGQTELTNCVESAQVVTCDGRQTSDLWNTLGSPPVTGQMIFTVRDQQIRAISWAFDLAEISAARAVMSDYEAWISENRPEIADQVLESDGGLATSEESAGLHLQLARDYVSSQGG